MDRFVIRLDLSKYFVGDKAKVIVLCNTQWQNVQKLKDHVEAIFQLEDIQFKTVDDYWIPLQENIELLRFIDLVKVYGKDETRQEKTEPNGRMLDPYFNPKRKLNEMANSFASSTPNVQKKFKVKDALPTKPSNSKDEKVLSSCFNNETGKSVSSTTIVASSSNQSEQSLEGPTRSLNHNKNVSRKNRKRRSNDNISFDENVINNKVKELILSNTDAGSLKSPVSLRNTNESNTNNEMNNFIVEPSKILRLEKDIDQMELVMSINNDKRKKRRNRKRKPSHGENASTALLESNDEKFSDSCISSQKTESSSPSEASPKDLSKITPRTSLLNDQNIYEKEKEVSLNEATIFANSTIKDVTCNRTNLEADKSSTIQKLFENRETSLKGEEPGNNSKALNYSKQNHVSLKELWVDDFSKNTNGTNTDNFNVSRDGDTIGPQNSTKYNSNFRNSINRVEQDSKNGLSLNLNNIQTSNSPVEKNKSNFQTSRGNITDSSSTCQELLAGSSSYNRNAGSSINEENSYMEDESCSVIAIETSEDCSRISSFGKDNTDTDEDTKNVSATYNEKSPSNNHSLKISEILPLTKELADLPNVGNIIIFKLQALKKGKVNGTTAYMAGKCEYINKRSKLIKITLIDGEDETSKISDVYFCNLDDTNDKKNLTVKFNDMIEPKIYN